MSATCDAPLVAISNIRASESPIDEADLDAAVQTLIACGFMRPLLLDCEDQLVCGRNRLEAARRLGLKSVPILRMEDLSLRQLQLHVMVESSPAAPRSYSSSVTAALNARAKRFWSNKRDIVPSILRDEAYNERFRRLLHAQSGRPVRRQQSEFDLARLALSGVSMAPGSQVIPRNLREAAPRVSRARPPKARPDAENCQVSPDELIATLKEMNDAQKERSRKGGMAKKSDELAKQIDQIVTANPCTSEKLLLLELKNMARHDADIGVIDIHSEAIEFIHNGRVRYAPINGLKDRLRRSKKRVLADRAKPASALLAP